MKRHRAFFNGKRCEFCNRPATVFRCIGSKCYVLCEEKSCDLKSRVREGFFDNKFDLGGKG